MQAERACFEISSVTLLTNLPYGSNGEDSDSDSELYMQVSLGCMIWQILWYPRGLEDQTSEEGYCCFKLRNEDDENDPIEIHCSFALMRNGKIIHEGDGFATLSGYDSYEIFNLVKVELLDSGIFDLKVTISLSRYSYWETTSLRFKKTVRSLKKNIALRSGKKSIEANRTVLSVISPIFKAKLGGDLLWSEEKSFDVGKEFENYLREFADFLEGDAIYLDITNKDHYDKLRALITFGDMYKVDNLLRYVLHELTANLSISNITNRLLLIKKFQHIKAFNVKAKSLTLWAYNNMTQGEFMDMTSKVFWSDSEL